MSRQPKKENQRSSIEEVLTLEHAQPPSQGSRAADHCKHEMTVAIARHSVFIIMEAAFASFAWYCYTRPRVLPELNFQPMTIKSAFITAFTLWHTIAVAGVFRICRDAFSRERAARPEQKTDAVSVVTSGILDRVLYFFSARATKTYGLALATFLGILLLHTTAPSTITVSSGLQYDDELPTGRISTSGFTNDFTRLDSQSFIVRLNQATMAVRLEKLAGTS